MSATSHAKKQLKAYEIREQCEGHCTVIFATNSATARREGANKLNTDWESIECCSRVQQFDQYAPGPVPPLVLIEYGWWFECSQCGRRVSEEMTEYLEEEGLNPDDFIPRAHGKCGVFCSASCEAKYHADKASNAAAKEELQKLVIAKFPGATIKHVHVSGTKLEPSEPHHGFKCSAEFTFPDAKYGATFVYGQDEVFVSNADVEKFKALYHGAKQ